MMAFVVAFFGAFRISELFPGSKKCSIGVRYDHVLVDELFVRFTRSRTDSLGRGGVALVAGTGR